MVAVDYLMMIGEQPILLLTILALLSTTNLTSIAKWKQIAKCMSATPFCWQMFKRSIMDHITLASIILQIVSVDFDDEAFVPIYNPHK
jgi:hypothetical protein